MNMFNVPINAALNSCAILFFVFLLIIYLSKKNAYNVDNLIYKKMLLWNAADLIFHFAFIITGAYYQVENSIVIYSAKLFLSFYTLFVDYLCIYIVVVCNQNNKNFSDLIEKKYKLFNLIISLVHLFIFLIIMVAPLSISFDKTGFTSYGIGLTVCYAFIACFIIPALVFSIKNRKVTERKKIFPFIVCAILGVISVTLGSIFPTLCVFVVFETIVSYIMFHTIENPDMRLITELEIAKDTAEKASNAKSDFLSSMSHELRTPLNAILGLSQVMKDTDDINEIKRDLDDIIVSSEKLLELVDGILDINKLENNQMEIVNSNYNPKELFDNIVSSMKIRIGDKNIELRSKISNDLPNTLYGDSEKIKLIINNIISNSIKYTDEGLIDLSVDCMNYKGEANLVISVTDTGRGISDEQMQHMFTKFYRKEEDKDSDIEGTGLGLALTKSLIDLMEGKISVNSIEGKGSTFIINLSQKIVEDDTTQKVDELI